jgi:hypothetical protein
VSLAQRFAAAVASATEGESDAALLPDGLARASADVLPVDGVGISVLAGGLGRSPLGASSSETARAERLQFTVGRGPCLLAHDSGQPVFVVEEDIRRRWPIFADLLFTDTSYRGIVSLPMRSTLVGSGALNLFFRDPAGVRELDVFDAVTVGDLVTGALGESAVWSTWSEAAGPDWARSPAALRRAAVWHAVGRTSGELDIDASEALAVLRGYAYAAGRTVDSVAADLVSGRLMPADVHGRAGGN